ncbi:MAG TPA: hypothetical protein VOB72_18445 [Candidatus Dormibacteraeota bacterium]|nr:hypothetical protein [Candidatus Dormibacteraeota bacterium]
MSTMDERVEVETAPVEPPPAVDPARWEALAREGADMLSRAEGLLRELTGLFALDYSYRQRELSLTASENYPSLFVRVLGAALHGGFYYYDPPFPADAGEWHFPDSGARAAMASILRGLGTALFEAQTFDWRPNGGAIAEQAMMLGTCSRGDALVHFAHRDGGHFALEDLAGKIGVQVLHLPMVQRTLLVDVDALAHLVRDHPNVKLVMLDQSFKLRWQPLLEIREALPPGIVLSYDSSHDGALIAGGALPQPLLQGAHVVHGNTHKTIPGPQKAFVAFANRSHPSLAAVSNWICPSLQSNSHHELLAPMVVAFAEIALFGRQYAAQVTRNARALAAGLVEEGFAVSGEHFGYTQTHQVHVVLGSADRALWEVTEVLPKAGFRINNVEIPGTNGSFGLRLGTQAMTRRGMTEVHVAEVARLLARAVLKREDPTRVRHDVEALLAELPLFPLRFSFDPLLEESAGADLLSEALK